MKELKVNRKDKIARALLTTLGVVGVLTVAIVAPNLVGAIGQIYKQTNKFTNKQLKRSLVTLEKRGLVTIKQEGKNTVIKLTKNGKEKLLKYNLDEISIKTQNRWDGKWRLVIFDIPREFKRNSTVFTRKLKEIGFVPLQKSIWVCPYPCEDEVDFLKEVFDVSPHVRIVTAEKIDIQNDLIKRFELSNR